MFLIEIVEFWTFASVWLEEDSCLDITVVLGVVVVSCFKVLLLFESFIAKVGKFKRLAVYYLFTMTRFPHNTCFTFRSCIPRVTLTLCLSSYYGFACGVFSFGTFTPWWIIQHKIDQQKQSSYSESDHLAIGKSKISTVWNYDFS